MSMPAPQLVDSDRRVHADVSLQRAFDIFGSSVAIALLAPVMLVIAVAIWMESGRPILFSQFRLGRRGKPFVMYKFRKFGASCGTDGSPLTRPRDCRLTSVGRILALTKIDELPQFFNVLKGDMSIVGPRPESLAFADCFSNGFEKLLDCRPGLFGPGQVAFRHEQRFFPVNADLIEFYRNVLFPAKANIDLEYFAHRSFLGDLGWVVRGVLAVVGFTPSDQAELLRVAAANRSASGEPDGAER